MILSHSKKLALLIAVFSSLPLAAQPIVPAVAKSVAKETASKAAQSVAPAVAKSVAKETASKATLNTFEKAALLKVNLHPQVKYPFKPYKFTEAPAPLSAAAKTLWEKPKPAGQQLGLAAVLHDQNAILDNLLKEQGGKGLEKAELQAQQQALTTAAQEMEKTLLVNTSFVLPSRLPRDFSGWEKVFAKIDSGVDKATVQRLFDGVPQPIFPSMTKSEIETFAALPSLAIQRAYIEDSITLCKEQMQRIINKDISAISDEEFSTYYLQKVRLDYFEQVQKALADATEKRTSLILREPVALEDGMPAMTDAQRIGYVQYQKDKLAKRISQLSADKEVLRDNLNQHVTLQQQQVQLTRELDRLQELYGYYARAEVFGIPYEKSFHIGATSFYLLPEKDAAYMLSLEGKALKREIQKRLAGVERNIAQKQLEFPFDTAFYADYYRLLSLRDIYQGQLRFAL